jgi:hypothetical protein
LSFNPLSHIAKRHIVKFEICSAAMAKAILWRLSAGIVATIALVVPMRVSASTAEDALHSYGPATVYVPFKRLYAFSVRCAALPCRITLTEHATVDGRHLPRLDSHTEPPIVMNEQPSAGPEPHCTEEEELENGATCPKKEAWQEAEAQAVYAVWFTPSDINRTLLNQTLNGHGSATLHVSATLIDAIGNTITARRLITLRPVAVRERQERHRAEEESRKENSPHGKIERAEDEYCTKVLDGTPGESFTATGHVYTRCEGRPDHEPEVTVSESQTQG